MQDDLAAVIRGAERELKQLRRPPRTWRLLPVLWPKTGTPLDRSPGFGPYSKAELHKKLGPPRGENLQAWREAELAAIAHSLQGSRDPAVTYHGGRLIGTYEAARESAPLQKRLDAEIAARHALRASHQTGAAITNERKRENYRKRDAELYARYEERVQAGLKAMKSEKAARADATKALASDRTVNVKPQRIRDIIRVQRRLHQAETAHHASVPR